MVPGVGQVHGVIADESLMINASMGVSPMKCALMMDAGFKSRPGARARMNRAAWINSAAGMRSLAGMNCPVCWPRRTRTDRSGCAWASTTGGAWVSDTGGPSVSNTGGPSLPHTGCRAMSTQ
jgi:hypothetical protein